jgi:hypothetical protein
MHHPCQPVIKTKNAPHAAATITTTAAGQKFKDPSITEDKRRADGILYGQYYEMYDFLLGAPTVQ